MEYSQASVYETGGRLAGQALRGQLTPGSTVQSILNPNALSLSERQTVADMASGDSRLVKMLGEIATNPFILMSLFVGPLGREALSRGHSFFNVRGRESVYAKKLGLWEMLGIAAPSELARGTHAAALGGEIFDTLQGVSEANARRVLTSKTALMDFLSQKHGVTLRTLNPDDYTGALREELQLIRNASRARMHRLDEGIVRGSKRETVKEAWIERDDGAFDPTTGQWVPNWVRHKDVDLTAEHFVGPNSEAAKIEAARALALNEADLAVRAAPKGTVPKQFRHQYRTAEASGVGEHRGAYVERRVVDRVFADYNGLLDDLVTQENRANKESFVRFLGDETKMMKNGELDETTDFVFDPDKLDRFMTSMHTSKKQGDSHQLSGRSLMELVVGKDSADAMWSDFKAGKIGEDAIRKRIEGALAPSQWQGLWHPSNHTRAERVEGVRPNSGRTGFDSEDGHDIEGLGHVIKRTQTKPLYHSDDLQELDDLAFRAYGERALTREGREHVDDVRKQAKSAWFGSRERPAKQEVVRSRTLRYEGGEQYRLNLAHAHAMHTAAVSDEIFNLEASYLRNIPQHLRRTETEVGVAGHRIRLDDAIANQPIAITRKMSPYAMLMRAHDGMVDQGRRTMFREVFLPAALGTITTDQAKHMAGKYSALNALRSAANGPFGSLITKMGGGRMIDSLKRLTDEELSPTMRGTVSSSVSKWLYATHMGLNLGSIAINLMQPLVLASVGSDWRDVAWAYGQAAKEMGAYTKARVKSGKWFMAADEQQQLINSSFKYGKLAGITPDWGKLLDAEAHRQRGLSESKWDRGLAFTMKGFEKSEWFNRSVTAHLMERMKMRAGVDVATDPHFEKDVERFVQLTQFGAHPMETPMVFGKRKSDVSWAGALSNPLARMFMSFPMRTVSTAFRTMPIMGEEEYATGLAKTVVRGLGLSALTYELGKGLLGVDLSKGLAVSAVSDVVGGDRFLNKDGNIIPLPPVVRIPLDFVRGVGGGDWGAVGDAVARAAVPGGVAFMRALNVAPQLPDVIGGLPQAFQKTYADYGNPDPATGLVPLYKADGSLIEYRSGAEIVMRGLGVDLGTWGQQGELDGYLIKQREEITKARHAFLMKLAANDVPGAMRVREQFGTKFRNKDTGQPIPLTVTREQIDNFLKNRQMGRTERILQGMPPELRAQYASAAESVGASRNVDLTAGPSAASRRPDGWQIEDQHRQMMDTLNQVGPAGL